MLTRSLAYSGRLLLLTASLTLLGCDAPQRPPVTGDPRDLPVVSDSSELPQPSAAAAPQADPVQSKNPRPGVAAGTPSDLQPPWETWDAYYIGSEHIGYAHVQAEPAPAGGTEYRFTDQMTLRRGAAKLTHRVMQQSLEDASGQLQSFEATIQIGPSETRVVGTRLDDQLAIEVARGAQASSRRVDWQDHYLGLLGVQQSLRQKPLRPGETRRLSALLPVHYEIGQFEMRASGRMAIPLLGGKTASLTEIRSKLWLSPTTSVDSFLWIDEQGETLKSFTPALNLIAYRTDEATATAEVTAEQDLLARASIELQGQLEQPMQTTAVRFRLSPVADLPDAAVPELPAAVGQRVQAGEVAESIEVSVNAGADADASVPEPGPADVAANPLIDFQHPRIRTMAATVSSGGSKQPREVALRAASFVHKYIATKDYSRGFSTASTVAQDATGDCTEHAVLLAALLRSQRIPTRIVAGLTYVETADGPAMMYHMWNVAYVDDAWLPLDATLGGIPPASRITVVTTDLASGNEYECLHPILGFMGRVQIEAL